MDHPPRLGPYRILRRLGIGGMAEVFLALHYGASGFEKRVAVKTLRREYAGDPHYERLLIEEATLGARLEHHCLVHVYDLGTESGRYYAAMEYVDGADLHTALSTGSLSPSQALWIAGQVGSALRYVHAQVDEAGLPLGLVHRDVSPSNILLSRWGAVKLADFGIAKATHMADKTHGNARKGKYAYMSPEQLRRHPLSETSDQFSLGVTLCELITGSRPFDGETILQTMENIQGNAPKLAGLPGDIAAFVARTVEKSPGKRFDSTADMCAALGALAAAYPPSSHGDIAALLTGLP